MGMSEREEVESLVHVAASLMNDRNPRAAWRHVVTKPSFLASEECADVYYLCKAAVARELWWLWEERHALLHVVHPRQKLTSAAKVRAAYQLCTVCHQLGDKQLGGMMLATVINSGCLTTTNFKRFASAFEAIPLLAVKQPAVHHAFDTGFTSLRLSACGGLWAETAVRCLALVAVRQVREPLVAELTEKYGLHTLVGFMCILGNVGSEHLRHWYTTIADTLVTDPKLQFFELSESDYTRAERVATAALAALPHTPLHGKASVEHTLVRMVALCVAALNDGMPMPRARELARKASCPVCAEDVVGACDLVRDVGACVMRVVCAQPPPPMHAPDWRAVKWPACAEPVPDTTTVLDVGKAAAYARKDPSCAFCAAPARFMCTCALQGWCSREHQVAGWWSHVISCPVFGRGADQPQGSATLAKQVEGLAVTARSTDGT